MGEAKRRKRERDAEDARPIVCRYLPIQAGHLVFPVSDHPVLDTMMIPRMVADAIRCPNAMRPLGWFGAGQEAAAFLAMGIAGKASDPGLAYVFDAHGSLMETTPDNQPTEWVPSEHDAHSAHRVAGDPVTIGATAKDGFTGPDGRAAADLPALFSGLGRALPDGRVVVPADASLCVQAAALSEALAVALSESDQTLIVAVVEHIQHLTFLAGIMTDAGSSDPAAWIDLSCFPEVFERMQDEGAPVPVVPRLVIERLTELFDDARPDDPMWRLIGRVTLPPDDWVSRDTPGSGLRWTDLDKAVAALPWRDGPGIPNVCAQFVSLDSPSPLLSAARTLVSACDPCGTKPRAKGGFHRDLDLNLALVEGEGRFATLVCWSPDAVDGDGRSDPLMAETLKDWMDRLERPDEDIPASRMEALNTLASLSLIEVLPVPDCEPDYAFLMLLAAHMRGLGLPDLCASLSDVVRSGGADVAFWSDLDGEFGDEAPEGSDEPSGSDLPDAGPVIAESDGDGTDLDVDERREREAVAEMAESFAGKADPSLVAMLSGIDRYDWEDVDLDRDLRNLRDAVRAGATLKDLAAVMLLGEDD